MSQTARDLCGQTEILTDLAANPRFTEPLERFQQKAALAALANDFMVPFQSALFTDLKPTAFKARADKKDDIYCLLDDDDTSDPRAPGGGWAKCAADLREDHPLSALPLAHNKLVALERSGLKQLASPFERTAVGKPVMDFLARWLLDALLSAQQQQHRDERSSSSL